MIQAKTGPDPRRRRLLVWMGSAALLPFAAACGGERAEARDFPIAYSDAEWRKRLTKMQYYILREHGTERPGSSPLEHEKRTGIFHCAGCDNALFPRAPNLTAEPAGRVSGGR